MSRLVRGRSSDRAQRRSPARTTRTRVLRSWGYRNRTYVVDALRVHYRPGTTDEKVIEEVLVRNEYQNRAVDFFLQPDDCWLDLGGNIGTFALFVRSVGAHVLSVEPEPENVRLLRKNLNANFAAAGHAVMAAGVALRSGTMQLYMAKGAHNKYRHSMRITKGRRSIAVPVVTLNSLLATRVGGRRINAVKMDIEGMEIELLEATAHTLGTKVRKLVFEYTFDADPSISRFLRIATLLRKSFRVVHHRKIDPREKEYTHFPPAVTVYCINPVS